MKSTDSLSGISNKLILWYEVNKRDLPWRDITDPYRIWISEIILQQTRVQQGLGYYNRFIERFPSVEALAQADEDTVLKYWQGLGYYSRARNLHKAAHQIMNEFGGRYPVEYHQVLKLAGIGGYTAAAVCSFAFNQPYAVVDGNVYRVLSRIFGIQTPIDSTLGKKEFSLLAQNLIPAVSPGLHNQAIMEFGALQCVPVNPDCNICPLQSICRAYELDRVTQLPVKSLKKKQTHRFFNYLFIIFQGACYLQKRVSRDVWQNLYEFPLIESDHLLDPSELTGNDLFKSLFQSPNEVTIHTISNPMKHILSHRVIFAQFISIEITKENVELSKQYVRVPMNEIDRYAVSRLMELFLEGEMD